jgi:urease accessory protein
MDKCMPRFAAHSIRRDAREAASDSVTLDYEGRFLRRKLLTTDAGAALMVDLPETVSLAEGDAFETVDGRLIAVRAAPEPLAEVAAEGAELARIAWHVGNRHTPAEIADGRLRIRRDPVLEAMLAKLGATVRPVMAPFNPEGGAYGHGRTHGHHHGGATDDPFGRR